MKSEDNSAATLPCDPRLNLAFQTRRGAGRARGKFFIFLPTGRLWNSKLPLQCSRKQCRLFTDYLLCWMNEAKIILLLSAAGATWDLKRQGPRKKSQPRLFRTLGHSEGGRVSDLLWNDRDLVIRSQIGEAQPLTSQQSRRIEGAAWAAAFLLEGILNEGIQLGQGEADVPRVSGVVPRWWPYSYIRNGHYLAKIHPWKGWG